METVLQPGSVMWVPPTSHADTPASQLYVAGTGPSESVLLVAVRTAPCSDVVVALAVNVLCAASEKMVKTGVHASEALLAVHEVRVRRATCHLCWAARVIQLCRSCFSCLTHALLLLESDAAGCISPDSWREQVRPEPGSGPRNLQRVVGYLCALRPRCAVPEW